MMSHHNTMLRTADETTESFIEAINDRLPKIALEEGRSRLGGHGQGYVYILHDRQRCSGAAAKFKVGYTERDPEKRLRDQRFECGKDYEFLGCFSVPPGWARLAEALIHLELKNRQLANCWCGRLETCACGRRHQEWFDIRAEELEQVVQFWVEFVWDLVRSRRAGVWADEPSAVKMRAQTSIYRACR